MFQIPFFSNAIIGPIQSFITFAPVKQKIAPFLD